ncbi:hypothetical protein [Sphingopyxis sp. NJF-3]
MTRRPASELSKDMLLVHDGIRRVVKNITKAGRSSLIVETDRGHFVFLADEIVTAYFEGTEQ